MPALNFRTRAAIRIEDFDAKILYVDDEPKALKYFEKLFNTDFEIFVAEGANEALEILKEHGKEIGVLVTDQRMPRRSGTDLLKEVRSKWPEIVSLLITAYTNIDEAIIAINHGDIFKYISKPFQPEYLKTCLWEAMNKHVKMRSCIELRKAHRQLNKAHEAKGEFINMLSHEVRTPITISKNLAGLLLETNLTDAQREYITSIKAVNENLANLLDNTLDHSKWEAGRLTLSKIGFSLDILLSQLHQTFKAQTEIAGLKYDIRNEANLDTLLKGDRDRLLQVLINLVGNAIKFTPSGGRVVVSVRKEKQSEDKLTLLFSVKDTGSGIDKSSIAKLFQPFSQAQQTKKGTGLGLYISQKLVQAMGGVVHVESEVGKGSEFSFSVEMEKDSQREEQLKADGAIRDTVVLLVDDNPINLKFVKKLLSDAGHSVDTAEDGLRALSLAKDKRYSIIITDCQMPELDGFQMASRIRKESLHNAKTPILAFTAMSQQAYDKRIQSSCIDDCITKPFNNHALLEKVGNWIRKREQDQSSEA